MNLCIATAGSASVSVTFVDLVETDHSKKPDFAQRNTSLFLISDGVVIISPTLAKLPPI
jgi:hypothetical protein